MSAPLIGFTEDEVAFHAADVVTVRGLDETAVDPRTGAPYPHLAGKRTQVVLRNRESVYLSRPWTEVLDAIATVRRGRGATA